MEKGFGAWSREFTPAQTAVQAGLDRFVSRKRNDFIGQAAFAAELESGPAQTLRLFAVESEDTDAIGNEPIFWQGNYAGFVTSGAWGTRSASRSPLAMSSAKRGRRAAEPQRAGALSLLGEPRKARYLAEPPVDPTGTRMRS